MAVGIPPKFAHDYFASIGSGQEQRLGAAGHDLVGNPLPVEKVHVSFIERGPLVATVEVLY